MSFLLKYLSLLIVLVLLMGSITGVGCFIGLLVHEKLHKLSIGIIAIILILALISAIGYWLIQLFWKILNSTDLYKNLTLFKSILLLYSFSILIVGETLFLSFLFTKIATPSTIQNFTNTALNATLIFSLGAVLYLSLHSILENTTISKKEALYNNIFSLNGIFSLFLKALGLLIGFLLLVGGGGCFAVIVVAGLFNPIESLKQLFSGGWVVLIPFCIGLFGWILIEKLLAKPSDNIYIDELEDDK